MTGAGWFHCEKGRRGRERNGGYDTCELYLVKFGEAVLCACVLKVYFRIA